MKKILYSLMAMGLLLTSCADFDSPAAPEVYPAGPSVNITVDEVADEAITFTVTPGEGAMYYSILVDESDEVAAVDSVTLYKGQYSSVYNAVIKASEKPSYTYTLAVNPNTTYQIYAVAGSDKGMVGSVAVKGVTSSDTAAPQLTAAQWDAENKMMLVQFSEAVSRGEGAVSAIVYKANDIANPIKLTGDDLQVLVSGKVIGIAAPTTYAGAYIAFSYEEGAFVDALGNKCPAMASGLNANGIFYGLYGRNTVEPLAITADMVTEPAYGGSFGDWTQFMGVITFNVDLYRKPADAGALVVTYTNSTTEKSIKLTSDMWAVSENTILFVLPEAPAFGDWVSVSIAEGVVADVYGNANEAAVIENAWLRSYGFKRADFMGQYQLQWVGYWDGVTNEELIEFVADSESENGVLVNNFFTDETSMTGVFNGDFGTVTVPSTQLLGTWNFVIDDAGNTAPYSVYFMDGTGEDEIVFQLAADGTFTTSNLWGYYLVDANTGSGAGWYDAAASTVAQKVVTSETAKTSVKSMRVQLDKVVKAKVLKK